MQNIVYKPDSDKFKFGLTFDIDWVSAEILKNLLELLSDYKVKATFFATHDSSVLKSLDNTKYEVGIHPNFKSVNIGDSEQLKRDTNELLNIYPESKGVRTHSLVMASPLTIMFSELDLLYDASLFVPYQNDIYPYLHCSGLMVIPFCWEDDIHYLYQAGYDFEKFISTSDSFRIFNFHPINIYYNISSNEQYQTVKNTEVPEVQLKEFRQKGSPGCRDFLIELLEHMQDINDCGFLMKNLAREAEAQITS